MSFLIDTNILIYRLKNVGNVNSNFLKNQHFPMSISAISYGELVFGAEKSQNREKNLKTVEAIRAIFPIEGGGDARVMEVFGQTKAFLQKSGMIVDDMDLMIVSTALANNMTLVTHNTKHFVHILGLSLEDWF